MKELIREELAKLDGQNDNKAYVAINGVVYDVTGNSHWTNGQRRGVLAGKGVVEALSCSSHDDSVLVGLEKVDTLKD